VPLTSCYKPIINGVHRRYNRNEMQPEDTAQKERLKQLLEKILANPPMKTSLRLFLLYGQEHARGVLLELDWGRVADGLTELCRNILKVQPTCSLALSGGKTPEALYLLLGTRHYQREVEWERVHLFWGDERYVPHDDPRSNYRMVREAWLSKANLPPENIHPMPTHYPNPDDAARAYEDELRAYFGDAEPYPHFDLMLLGLGEDGHIASLFPNDPALEETTRWVVPSRAPVEPHQRLTLTLPVINHAYRIWFLVKGVSKREAIEKLFREPADTSLPAARVEYNGERFWWLSPELLAIAKQ